MNKDDIIKKFKKTKLGKKIYKRYFLSLIMFIITHVIMLITLIIFAQFIEDIVSGIFAFRELIFGILLFLSALFSFVSALFCIYYQGKIDGCIELFRLILKAKLKTGNKD